MYNDKTRITYRASITLPPKAAATPVPTDPPVDTVPPPISPDPLLPEGSPLLIAEAARRFPLRKAFAVPADDATSEDFHVILRRKAPRRFTMPKIPARIAIPAAAAVALTGIATGAMLWLDEETEVVSVCTANELDNILWEGGEDTTRQSSIARAEALLPTIRNTEQRAVAEAVIGYWKAGGSTNASLPDVSGAVAGSGLVRYAQFIYYMRSDQYKKAKEVLLDAMSDNKMDCADHWDTGEGSGRRYMLAHMLMRSGDYSDAYRIASSHSSKLPGTQVDFEWLSGYIKIKQEDPAAAIAHFEKAVAVSKTPISIARGEYWLAKAYGLSGNTALANDHYAKAAMHQTAYYGQLASAKIGKPIHFEHNALLDGAIPNYSAEFRGNEHFRNAENALVAGDAPNADKYLANFVRDLFKDKDTANADTQIELQRQVIFLTRLANQNGNPSAALKIAKQASRLGVVIPELIYPMPQQFRGAFAKESARSNISESLIIGLARRESEFNPGATSPKDARGLMQLLPATGNQEAFIQTGVHGSGTAAQLYKPDYNIRMGTSFLSGLIDRYGGSVIMAVGAYNAGPGAMDRWAMQFGDPRKLESVDDVVDFIESEIPASETREYLMRVTEGMVAYEALNGRQPSLERILLQGLRPDGLPRILPGTEITARPNVHKDAKGNYDPPLAIAASFDCDPDNMFRNEGGDIRAVPASLTKVAALDFVARTMKDRRYSFNMDTMATVTPFVIRQAIGLADFDTMTVGRSYRVGDLGVGAGAKSDARSTVMTVLAAGRARGYQGTEAQIYAQAVQDMRLRSEQLGMTNTFFMDATGEDSRNYSTPIDMMKLVRAFSTEAPITFDAFLGQSHVNIPMLTNSDIPSSRFLRYHGDMTIGAKTGKLNIAGFNELGRYRFPNGLTATLVMFGADSPEHRQQVIREQVGRLEQASRNPNICPSR